MFLHVSWGCRDHEAHWNRGDHGGREAHGNRGDHGGERIKTYGGFLVSQVKQLGGRVFERLLRESGVDAISGAQGRILYVLWEHERPTITQLGRYTSLAKTTLTGMLDHMEAAGLIRREPDPHNRRQVYIALTPKASAYRQAYDRVSDAMNDIYYRGFTEAEVRAFEDALRRVIANLETEETP